MYELTGDKAYLRAAHRGAKLYTQYVWYSPAIPDRDIPVNPDGKAPHYQYLKSKGHAQMDAPAERVPAWRLSEIGLTPESSGTSTGHRGIFMANYAAWMLRLAHYTGDGFLARTADHAVIGRYRNFPGYHINTARTTVYEKADYPLRGHMELGANSFHYNHIMPHISLLYDFLVTQALFRAAGRWIFRVNSSKDTPTCKANSTVTSPAQSTAAKPGCGCRRGWRRRPTGSSTTFRPSTTTRCISFS